MRSIESQSSWMEIIWNNVICDDAFNRIVDEVFNDNWHKAVWYLERYCQHYTDDQIQKFLDTYKRVPKGAVELLRKLVIRKEMSDD